MFSVRDQDWFSFVHTNENEAIKEIKEDESGYSDTEPEEFDKKSENLPKEFDKNTKNGPG